MSNWRLHAVPTLTLVGSLGLGCGSRDSRWDSTFEMGDPIALEGSAAVVDLGLGQAVFLSAPAPERLEVKRFDIGQNLKAMAPSRDGKRLFVLTEGKSPRLRPDDEPPSLKIFSGGTTPKLESDVELDDPMGGLALDPQGDWAIAFAGDASVNNPNELVLLDLNQKNPKPRSKTLRSFGGSPKDFVFTDELAVPEGSARRFLVVRTDRDVALVDLSDLDQSEATIRLPKDASGTPYSPAQIVFDDGEPDDPTDARLAVRLDGSSDVVICQLAKPSASGKDYSVQVNIVDVGGIPSALDFVHTDAGLRLAALVPSRSRATLVDPTTTATETVDLGAPFSKMSRITQSLSSAPSSDVALLWGGNASKIAFWSLGSTSGTPYRSVDATELDLTLSRVLDVAEPNGHLKVLVGEGAARFFVLDLESRESFPLETRSSGFQISVARDGERLWALAPGTTTLSMVELEDLHPTSVTLAERAGTVLDIARKDGGRAAIVLHTGAFGLSATLLDARDPDPTAARYFPALHLEGLQ